MHSMTCSRAGHGAASSHSKTLGLKPRPVPPLHHQQRLMDLQSCKAPSAAQLKPHSAGHSARRHPATQPLQCLRCGHGWQVCKAGLNHTRKIWLTRHGESEYNTRALLGGNSGLSPKGQAYARQLPDIIVDRIPLVGPDDHPSSSPKHFEIVVSTFRRTG